MGGAGNSHAQDVDPRAGLCTGVGEGKVKCCSCPPSAGEERQAVRWKESPKALNYRVRSSMGEKKRFWGLGLST